MNHIYDKLELSNIPNLHAYIKNVDIEDLPQRINKA